MSVEDPAPASPASPIRAASPVSAVQERIEKQRAVLDDIQQRPLGEHAALYNEVHTQLQAALTELDGGPA
jgi:hypothetical protein